MYPSSFRTLAIATLTPDDGMWTVAFSASCALRMRVSMSAIGSVMLICDSLPARLDDARDLAAHRDLAQLVAAEPELSEHAPWTPGQRAAIAQPGRARVARQRLQLAARRGAILFGKALV